MEKSVIIDTNVFIDSCTMESDWTVECMKLVLKIHDREFQLGVDSQGEIIKEYERNLRPFVRKNHLATIIMAIIKNQTKKSGRIKTYIPINETKIKELIDMNFHKDDIKFVRIAPRTRHKMIISTDTRSFLKEEYKSWIEEKLKVVAKHPSEYDEIILILSN